MLIRYHCKKIYGNDYFWIMQTKFKCIWYSLKATICDSISCHLFIDTIVTALSRDNLQLRDTYARFLKIGYATIVLKIVKDRYALVETHWESSLKIAYLTDFRLCKQITYKIITNSSYIIQRTYSSLELMSLNFRM